jgi:hypothetical protein
MQRVQSLIFCVLSPLVTVTVWMLGLNRRRVWRLEKLTALPNDGPLPQLAHFAIEKDLQANFKHN